MQLATKHTGYWLLSCIICATCFLCFFIVTPWHNWGGDYSAYIMQAESILHATTKQFFEANAFTIQNSDANLGPIVYPWGTPFFLAIASAIFGSSIITYKASMVIIFLFFLLTCYIYFKNLLSNTQALFLVCCFAFNFKMLHFLNNILSDIPFLFISTLAVLFIDDKIRNHKIDIKTTSIFAIIAFLATTIRSNGILLIILLPIAQYIAYSPKNIFHIITPYFIYVSLYTSYKNIFILSDTHLSILLESVTLNNILYYSSYYSTLLKDFFPFPYSKYLYLCTLPFFIYGLINRYKKDYIFIIYSAATVGLYIIWPFTQGIRFIFPIIPFYIYFIIVGTTRLIKSKKINYLFILITTLLLIGNIYKAFIDENKETNIDSPYSETSQEIFKYIIHNIPEESVISFFKPRVLRLETKRNAVWKNSMEKVNIDYILSYKHSYGDIPKEEIEKLETDKKITKIFSNTDYNLYEVK